LSEPYPADELADTSSVASVEKACPTLSADGRELVVADVFDQQLSLRVVDAARSQVVRPLSLRTPRPLGGFPSVPVEGRKVTVMGDEGIRRLQPLGALELLVDLRLQLPASLLEEVEGGGAIGTLRDLGRLHEQGEVLQRALALPPTLPRTTSAGSHPGGGEGA